MNEYHDAMEFYGNQFDTYMKEIKAVSDENKKLKIGYEELEKKYNNLEKEMEELKLSNEDDRQYSRNHNLQISRIIETTKEDLYDTVVKLGRKIGLEVVKSDIQVVHRINSNNSATRPIIVQFTNKYTRDEYLLKCKSWKPSTGLLFNDSLTTLIYVNEHLTPYYRDMMIHARNKTNEVGQKLINLCGLRKLFVRSSEASKILRVRSRKHVL